MKRVTKNILLILIIAVLIVSTFPINIFAAEKPEQIPTDPIDTTPLTIEVVTDTDMYNVGENVITRINWDREMQAAEFTLEFDSTKLSLLESTVEEDFYNVKNNEIVVSKISLDDTDFTGVQFTFTAIDNGEVNIALKEVSCFADGSLASPETIDYTTKGTKNIEIRRLGDLNFDGVVDSKDSEQLSDKLALGDTAVWDEMEWINADVNMDGYVDKIDVELILQAGMGALSLPVRYGDINLDKKVDNEDVLAIQAFLNEGASVNCSCFNMDVNLDGNVNGDDETLIAYVSEFPNNLDLPVRVFQDGNLKIGYLKSGEKIFYNVNDSRRLALEQEWKKAFGDYNFKVELGSVTYEWDSSSQLGGFKGGTSDEIPTFIGTGVEVYVPFVDETDIGEGESTIGMTYTMVLFGDTTGDGRINAIDALALIKDINEKIPFASEIYRQAGRIVVESDDDAPTSVDALAIIKHATGKYQIDQSTGRVK